MRLQVLSFNIRTSTGDDGPNHWRWRRNAAAAVIRRADLAGLQEARADQLDDLTAALADHRWFGRGRADGERGGEHVPVLWRDADFASVDQGVFWHSSTPDVPGSRDHEQAITRMATWVRLRHRRTGQRVFLLNTHLDHRVPEARLAAADQIRAEVDRRAADDPVIVLGDLNDRPDSPTHRRLCDDDGDVRLRDARRVARTSSGPDSTLHGFAELRPGVVIDHVLVSEGWTVHTHTVIDGQVDGRWPSDHCPVVVDLEI